MECGIPKYLPENPGGIRTGQIHKIMLLHVRTRVRACFCSEGALIEKIDHR